MPSITKRAFVLLPTALLAASAACSAVPRDDLSSTQSESAAATESTAARAPRGVYKLVDDPTAEATPASLGPCGAATLQYGGGQVISNVEIVQVSWGASVDPKIISLFETWYPALVTSPHLAWLSEYDTTTPGNVQHIGFGTYKKNPSSAGAWTITPANHSTTLQDADVAKELVAQIAANHLPAPSLDANGNSNTLYMIDFPHGVSISLGLGATSCVSGGFCGYHQTTSTAAGDKVYYGVHPDMSAGSGCAPAAGKWHCGGSLDEYVGAAVVHAHEMVEAITDPENNSAWIDRTPKCGEIGDICANQKGSCDAATCLSPSVGDLSIGGSTYYVQTEWSNKQNDCIVQVQDDSGSPVDAGPADTGVTTDSGHTDPDAGVDSGPTSPDAGSDAGSGGHPDAGSDAATSHDSGLPTTGNDGGTPIPGDDSGSADDASPGPAADASTGNGGSGGSSGCGCVVAGGGDGRSQAGGLAGLLLGLVAIGRRRRSRR